MRETISSTSHSHLACITIESVFYKTSHRNPFHSFPFRCIKKIRSLSVFCLRRVVYLLGLQSSRRFSTGVFQGGVFFPFVMFELWAFFGALDWDGGFARWDLWGLKREGNIGIFSPDLGRHSSFILCIYFFTKHFGAECKNCGLSFCGIFFYGEKSRDIGSRLVPCYIY